MGQYVGGLVAEIGKECTAIVPGQRKIFKILRYRTPLLEQSYRPRIVGLVTPQSGRHKVGSNLPPIGPANSRGALQHVNQVEKFLSRLKS